MNTIYLNGEFLPLAQACISVQDRGFIFGDGVYEVIPVYEGQLFRLSQHLQRLERSLDKIRLANPLTQSQWETTLHELIDRNGGGNQTIYLQVTRGEAERTHHFPATVKPTVFIRCNPFAIPTSDGVKVITAEDTRWSHCDIKSIALLNNVLLRQQAIEAQAVETILIRQGQVTEGAATNVFVVLEGIAITPPKNQFILAGITRELILELMQEVELPCREAVITESQLRQAEEIWISSSTRELSPVVTLDDQTVGNGQPGQLYTKVYSLFQTYKQRISHV